MVAQFLLPPHADALEELLIVVEIRHFFFSTIPEDLRQNMRVAGPVLLQMNSARDARKSGSENSISSIPN